MSHFTVLVIGDNPEEQLKPYDENIEMDRYVSHTKEQLIKRKREEIKIYSEGYYAEYLKDKKKYVKECNNKNHIKYIEEEFPKRLTWTDEECYLDEIRYCEKEDIGKDGEIYSTYNPKSKWDWYQLGGRWYGLLKLKKGKTGTSGELGLMDSCFNDDDEHTDQAKKGDIDFTPTKEIIKNLKRKWELIMEGKKPKNKEEKEILTWAYKKEYYLKEYDSKEDYIKRESEFGTFAVLKDGVWYEKGSMGWFGCSSATHNDSKKWDKSFFEKWIKNLSDETLLSVYDCHK